MLYYLEGKTKGPPYSISKDEVKLLFKDYKVEHIDSYETTFNGDNVSKNVFIVSKLK